jgi:hypothetical protein
LDETYWTGTVTRTGPSFDPDSITKSKKKEVNNGYHWVTANAHSPTDMTGSSFLEKDRAIPYSTERREATPMKNKRRKSS